MFPITEHVVKSPRHTSFYLGCGPEDGPLVIFVHGWPELSISWRHQLPAFGALGFRAIAPDMRGYGRSSAPARQQDYAMEPIVADMMELLAATGRDRAIWVGHDWGSPVVWSIASHHPERCHGVANLCVPYLPKGFSPEALVDLVDRAIYPTDQFPAGQWEYMLFYRENFERAHTVFEADVAATAKALFRKGDPAGAGKPSRTASIRKDGGWFGGRDAAPDLPLDTSVLTPTDLQIYVAALTRNGFSGPDSWYVNGEANMAYAATSANDGSLDMPVLFMHAAYDYTCETTTSRLGDPMRAACPALTEARLNTGHWMAQENPAGVNAALARWVATQLPGQWPGA